MTETPEQTEDVTPSQENGSANVTKQEPEPEAPVEAVEEKLEDLTIEPVTNEVTYHEVEASTSEDDDSGGEWISKLKTGRLNMNYD